MILNYDKENGFTSAFFPSKKDLEESSKATYKISDNVHKLFTNMDDGQPFSKLLQDFYKADDFKDDPFKGWVEGLDKTKKGTLTCGQALDDFKKSQSEVISNNGKFSKITSTLKDVAGFAGSFLLNAGVSFAIEKVFDIVSDQIYKRSKEGLIQQGNEARDTIQQQSKAYLEQKNSIEQLTTRYSELANGVSIAGNQIKNISLNADEYTEFLDVSNKLANTAPTLLKSFDSQGNAILHAGSNVNELNTQVQDYLKLQRDLTYYNTKDNIQTQYKGISAQLKEYNNTIETNQKDVDNLTTRLNRLQKIQNAINKGEAFNVEGYDLSELSEFEGYFQKEQYQANIGQDGKWKFSIDTSQLNNAEGILSRLDTQIKTITGDLNTANENIAEAQTLTAEEVRQIIPSMQIMAQTTNAFDSWDQDEASKFQQGISSVIGNLDDDFLIKNIAKFDNNIESFINDGIIRPIANSEADVRKSWEHLFEFNPNSDENRKKSIAQLAQERNAWLETIANVSDKDIWDKDTLADMFGFGYTDETGEFIWKNRQRLDDAKQAFIDAGMSLADAEKLRNTLNTEMSSQDFELAYSIVLSGDEEALSSISNFQSKLKELQKQAEADKYSLSSMQSVVANAQTAFSSFSTGINESMSDTGMTTESIDALKDSFARYVELDNVDDKNLNALFTNTAKGVKLNSKALEDLIQTQHKLKMSDFIKSMQQYKALSEDINKSQEERNQAELDLYNVQQAQAQYLAQYKQQMELFSQYNKWQMATQSENAGDKYNNLFSGLKQAKDLYDKGLVGTDEFKEFAALLSPSGATDADNFLENYNKAARYLTEDSSGVQNFLHDLSEKGFAKLNEQTQEWTYNIQDMAKAAQKMGMGEEFMTAMFGRLEDYGASNNFFESIQEGQLHVNELNEKLLQGRKELALLEASGADETAITAKREEVNGLINDIMSSNETMNNLESNNAKSRTEEILNSKKAIEKLAEEYKALDVDNNGIFATKENEIAGKNIKATIKALAADAGITLKSDLEIDTDAWEQLQQSIYGTGTVENPLSRQFEEGSEAAQNYGSVVSKIQEASAQGNETVAQSFDTLLNYSQEELSGIDLFDGKYDSDTLQPAEQALDNIVKTLGLSKEEATQLVNVLADMGKIQLNPNAITQDEVSNLSEVQDLLKENGTIEKKVDLTFDTSSMSNDDLLSKVEELEGLKAHIDAEVDPKASEEIDALIAKCNRQYELNVKIEESGVSPEEILGGMTKEDFEAEVGVTMNDEEWEAFKASVQAEQNASISVKIDQEQFDALTSKEEKIVYEVDDGQIQAWEPPKKEGNVNYKSTYSDTGNPPEKLGNVKYIGDWSGIGTPPDANGIANFSLGESPDEVPDASGIANFDLGEHPTKAPDIYGTAIYLGNFPKAAPTIFGTAIYTQKTKASGTLLSPAKVSGTAYNVLNTIPYSSYASGKVSLDKDETALVNEVGIESRIRNGVWELLPGKMHMENLKKGDIILNAKQTADLLKHGKTNSFAKSYASGTAEHIRDIATPFLNSYRGGTGNLVFQGGAASGSNSSSTSQNTQAVNQNTQAQNQNTQATSSNTDAAKKSTQAFDWVKNRLDYFAKQTQQIADQITDYVSYAIKKSRIMLQRASMDREIKAQQKGYETYMKKAEQTASNYEYYDDNGNKKTLSIPKNYQDRVIYGKWNIEEMDTSTEYGKNLADAIQKFKEYTDAANECISSIQQLQNEQMELWEDLVNIPLDEAEEKIDRISNALQGLESAYDTISSGGSGISKLDKQILSDYGITKSEQRLEKAKKDERVKQIKKLAEKEKVEKADKNLKSEQSDLKKTDKKLKEEKKKTSKTINSVKFQAKKTGNKKVVDKVYDAIKNAEYIDLKGLSGEVRKSADKYNKQLKAQREVQKVRNSDKDTALQADKEAKQAQKNYDKANKKYQDAKKKRQEAQKDLKDRNNLLSDTQKEVIKNNGKPTFVTQNAILDAQYKQKKEESEAYEQAYWDSKSTVDKSKKEWDKKLAERNKKKDSLLKDDTTTKNLSKAQLNAIKSGNLVDRTGISDPKTLEQINKWNKAVEEARKKENEYNIALKANEKAQANMAQSQAEYAQMAIENEQEKLENIKNYYTSQMDYEESLQKVRDSKVALNEAKGISKTDADIKNEKDSLLKRQKLAQQQAKDMQKQLDESVKKGIIKEGSEEWNKMQEMIHDCQIEANNLGVSIEELNNEMANLKIDQFEKLLDLLSAMQGYFHSIIDFIKSSGKFVMDDADAMKAYQDAIKNAGDMADNYQQQANEDWLNYEKALAASTEKEKQVYGGKSADEWKQAYYEDMKNMYDSKAEQHKLDWEVRELPLEELNAEFQNLKSTLDLIESGLDLKEAQGKYLSAMDYAKQQAALQEQIAKQEQINAHNKLLYEQASAIGADALASEYFDAWKSGEAEINSMQSSIEELADKIRDDFAEGCKRAIDSISDLRSVLESELDIKESQGKYLTKEDYEAQIRLNQDAYEQQMKLAADRYQKAQEARMAGNEAEADQLISEARKAEAEANKLLAVNEELQKQIQNLFRDTIQRELDALEAAMKVIESEVNLKQAQDRDLDKADYDKQMESKLEMIKKQSALARENERLYNLEVSKGNMQAAAEYLQAWKDAEAEVNNLRGDIEELGDEMRKTLLTKELDEMLEKLDAFRKSISTITGMISEDMMFDKNGHLTDFGTASLALNLKEYESQTDSLKTLMDKRKKYIEEFNNGKNEHYSQNEFDEDMKNITSEIQDMLSNASDSRQAIIDMITKTSKMEIDALSEVIDKRKELLQAQKDAYNFDKSLKSQTNDLTMLMKQKEALEGLTDKESQAKLQKLNQQIKEAQEALNDTITDHSFDLKIEGLDDLKESISDAYEDYVKELNSNLDAITDAVGNATDMVVGALGSVENAIDKLLQSFGVSGLDKDVIGYDKPHKPTEKPNTNDTTNATRKSVNTLTLPGGTVLIPYHADEHSLLNTDVTQKLIDNINSMQTMPTFEMPKLDVKELIRSGSEGNQDVIIKDIGGIHVYDATDPNAIMGVIHKNIKTVAKDVGTEFSKNVSKVGNKRTWG